MHLRRRRALAAIGAVSALLGMWAVTSPAGAADGGAFTRTPAFGAPGTTVAVASDTPCPQPPAPGAGKVADANEFVRFYLEATQETFAGEVDADDTTGVWSGTITIPAGTAPGTIELHPFCSRFVDTRSTCSTDGVCFPGTSGEEDYYAYAPMGFDVCPCSAPTTSSTAPTSTSSTTTLSTIAATTSTSSSTTTTQVVTTSTIAIPATPPPGVAFSGPTAETVLAGRTISVDESGFGAGDRVAVVIYSVPVHLATLVADGSGRVTGSIQIPSDTPTGRHTLALIATNVVKVKEITVVTTLARTGSSSSTSRLALGAALLALAGGGFCRAGGARPRSASRRW